MSRLFLLIVMIPYGVALALEGIAGGVRQLRGST